MKEFWDGLTSMQKVIVIVVVAIILYLLWNQVKGTVKGLSASIQAGGEIRQLENAGIVPSYSDSQYKKMADDLWKAMDGWGTDITTVYATFDKLKNDADFIKLDTAFGIREATDNLFGFLESEDLTGWIRDDLNDSQIIKLNRQLANKGITKSF